MRRLWNRCGRYRESLCLLASGALPEAERSEVQDHLADCAACRQYFEEIKSVTVPLAEWERNFVQVEPKQAVRTRWARAIEASGEPQIELSRPGVVSFVVLWRELIWPCRRAWTGMAALWFVMLWINLGPSDHRPSSLAARSAPASETWQTLQEQRRLLAELIPPATSQPAEPPRRNNPRPRSQSHETRLAC